MSSVYGRPPVVKGVCPTYQDQYPDETQSSTAFDAQSNPSKNPVETRLPDCFTEHHAPQSVVKLFTAWVYAADETLNGVIVVNRQRQRYNATTVDRATAWLTSHHLVFLVERGGGRGNGNRYFVRWSFIHETLSARQNAVNHSEYAKTLHLHKYARVEALKLSEEQHTSKKLSLDESKTSHDVSPVENSKRERFRAENEQKRRLRNERATRWAMAQLRKVSDDADALTASAKAIRRALRTGAVWIGVELAKLTEELAWSLEELETQDVDAEEKRRKFSFVGFETWSVGLRIYGDRRNAAEFQQREREREEAQEHPLSELLAEENVESISQLIRRQAATAGAVVRSDNRERRQRSEPYQRAKDLQGALYGEHAARVYGEPASIGDMMSGYLEKLGGGDGVDEVAGIETDEQAR